MQGRLLLGDDDRTPHPRAVSELGISHLLQGSPRLDDAALRMSAQLLEVDGGRVYWAETLDAEVESCFEIQDHITETPVEWQVETAACARNLTS